MKPKPQDRDAFKLFQAHFDQLLNPQDALVPLAKKIDWGRFETALASCYTEDMGAPAKATRPPVRLASILCYTGVFNIPAAPRTSPRRWAPVPVFTV